MGTSFAVHKPRQKCVQYTCYGEGFVWKILIHAVDGINVFCFSDNKSQAKLNEFLVFTSIALISLANLMRKISQLLPLLQYSHPLSKYPGLLLQFSAPTAVILPLAKGAVCFDWRGKITNTGKPATSWVSLPFSCWKFCKLMADKAIALIGRGRTLEISLPEGGEGSGAFGDIVFRQTKQFSSTGCSQFTWGWCSCQVLHISKTAQMKTGFCMGQPGWGERSRSTQWMNREWIEWLELQESFYQQQLISC